MASRFTAVPFDQGGCVTEHLYEIRLDPSQFRMDDIITVTAALETPFASEDLGFYIHHALIELIKEMFQKDRQSPVNQEDLILFIQRTIDQMFQLMQQPEEDGEPGGSGEAAREVTAGDGGAERSEPAEAADSKGSEYAPQEKSKIRRVFAAVHNVLIKSMLFACFTLPDSSEVCARK